MTRLINTPRVKPCEELPSAVFLVGINECNEMLRFIPTMNETINKLIANLNQAVEDAETLRRNVLISKTTGVVAASVGTTLNVIGIILIPFTVGLSVPILCGTGTALAVSGTVTSIGTTIAEIPIKKSQSENITNLLYRFKELQERYDAKTKELEQALQTCDLSEFQYIGEFFKRERELDVTKWLEAGHLHKDEDVNINDLRKGDHIYRTIKTSPLHQHHGIYINDNMVVELTEEGGGGIKSRSLKAFAQSTPLKRRLYGGYELPADEIAAIAQVVLNEHKSLHSYNLLTYNCEHFATSMKLNIRWSEQVDSAIAITSDVFKNIHRPMSLILEGIESGAQITAALAPKSIFTFFNSISTPVMSGLSKAAIVLAPISVALDITSLVFEYKKQNTSADMCNKTLKELKEYKSSLQEHNRVLIAQRERLTERRHKALQLEQEVKRLEEKRMEEELRRLEAKRAEDEREELRRLEAKRAEDERMEQNWRERMGLKFVSFRKALLNFYNVGR